MNGTYFFIVKYSLIWLEWRSDSLPSAEISIYLTVMYTRSDILVYHVTGSHQNQVTGKNGWLLIIFVFLLTINTQLKLFSIFLLQDIQYFFQELHCVVTSMILQLSSESTLMNNSLKIIQHTREKTFLIALCIIVTIKLPLSYYFFLSLLLSFHSVFLFNHNVKWSK